MEGLLTKDQENAFAELIDDAINAKGIAEAIDGLVAKVAVSYLDNNVLGKLVDKYDVSEEIKSSITAIADSVIDQDLESAIIGVGEVLDMLIDIPKIDDEGEAIIFVGFFTVIAGAIKKRQVQTLSDDSLGGSQPPAPGQGKG